MKPRYQSFTRIGRQSQSLKRQVYADWTSVSFPLCKPLHGQYKFERNHEKKIKNIANSMQYIAETQYRKFVYIYFLIEYIFNTV